VKTPFHLVYAAVHLASHRGLQAARCVGIVALIASCAMCRNAQAQALNEYEAKAAFLFNFLKFVDWPAQAFADDSAPLVIGIVGDDKSSERIEQLVNGKSANGRQVVVKRFPSFKQLTYCHLVFVRASERERLPQILSAARSGSLIVGETDSFARWGGAINFSIEDGKIRLEINQKSAERAGLKISAKLLSIARIVKD
jgi:hypothetical protein